MDLKAVGRAAAAGLSKHSPTILTAIGIGGFVTTCIMVAKAAPPASDEHARRSYERERILEEELPVEATRPDILESYKQEALELAKLYGPAALVGTASVACFVGANKINLDRQAAVLAAYSLSADTLAKYQEKVIEKLGDDANSDILSSTLKEVADAHQEPGYNYSTEQIPAGTVRVYDNVTGRYFYCSRERIMEAESEVNRRLLAEARVPLQEFYYAMGLEERFNLGEILGWDISGYSGVNDCLNVMFGPHLDDDKNPCLAITYHVGVLHQRGA